MKQTFQFAVAITHISELKTASTCHGEPFTNDLRGARPGAPNPLRTSDPKAEPEPARGADPGNPSSPSQLTVQ
ncbi:hypothetical protein GCM10009642_58390 [Nocardiopsis metallicus]|uniref:Uncharacterized protein n=1 Tax=Nocardiopsis metallicus TaxID=179819 RepID=A0A840W8Z1_9ACTN|nr:hypothetical protein [Nocardiopsis metallicus]